MCADRTGPLEEENAGTGTAMTRPLEEENTGTGTAMTRPLEEENAGTGTAMTGPLEEENTGTRTAMTRPLEEENAGTGTARLGPDLDPVIQGTLDEMNLGPLSDYLLQHLDFPRGIAILVLTRVTMFLLLPFHERGGTSMSEPAVIFGSDDQFTLSSTLEPGPGMDDMLLDGQQEAPWFTAITWRPAPVPRPPPKMPNPKWPVPKWPPAGLAHKAPPLPKQVRPKQPPPLPRFQ